MGLPTTNNINNSGHSSLSSEHDNNNSSSRGRSLKRASHQKNQTPLTYSASLATSPYLSGPIRAKATKVQRKKKQKDENKQSSRRLRGKSPYSVPGRLTSPPNYEKDSFIDSYQSDRSIKQSRKMKKNNNIPTAQSASETDADDDCGSTFFAGRQQTFASIKSPCNTVSSPFTNGFSPYEDSMSCSGLSRIGSRSTLRSRQRRNNLVVRTILLPSEVDEMIQDYKRNKCILENDKEDEIHQSAFSSHNCHGDIVDNNSNPNVKRNPYSMNEGNDDESTLGSDFAESIDDEGVLCRYKDTLDSNEAEYLYQQFENISTWNHNHSTENDGEDTDSVSSLKLPPVDGSIDSLKPPKKISEVKTKEKTRHRRGKRKGKKKRVGIL